MNLLLSLMFASLLLALSLGLLVVTNIESAVSANFKQATDAVYAAEAGIELAVSRLVAAADWTPPLAEAPLPGCAGPAGATLTPTAFGLEPWWGADSPTWRLYACERLGALLPPESAPPGFVVAVWLADDVSEGDGNPLEDQNGTLTVRAEAHGPVGAHAAVEAAVSRAGTDVRTLSWRVLR